MAGREFFDPAYCTPVPEGDLLAFARGVEEAITAYETDREAFIKRGLAASTEVLGRYTTAGLCEDLRAFCRPLLETVAAAE